MSKTMIVCVSDTHGNEQQLQIPDGDLLIHTGDFSKFARLDLDYFCSWLASLPHQEILITCGNHEKQIQRDEAKFVKAIEGARKNVHLVIHGAIELLGLKCFASSWQPEFYSWGYNLPRGPALAAKWADIPLDTQILATHTPPYGILDQVGDEHVGCEELRNKWDELNDLRLATFGHIHVAHGMVQAGKLTCVNAAICDDHYKPVNAPTVVEVEL